jgi:DNA polymerase I-like protein with 3'-5' exonuclease and polymerase domains
LSDETVQQPIEAADPDAPVKKTRKPRKPKDPNAPPKPPKVVKPKKVKPARDLRSVFRQKLSEVTEDSIKKPWMAEKSFRLVDNPQELEAWVDGILADTSRHHQWAGKPCPVIAVDTETTSLDTRILFDIQLQEDGTWKFVYKVHTELAGVCLSADGIEGLYIPVNHEKGNNISREDCARILQRLFDQSHLVFYNAKFDREVLRISLGLNLRGYPHFEDVQVLKYINDPKADLGDKGAYSGDAKGLKGLSKTVLGIEQIELEELAKVRAYKWNVETQKNTLKDQHVPFTWVPTRLALWYAAGDAICTWLLWAQMKDLARSRKLVHRIDHELVETLTFVERQRFRIDVNRQRRTARWHSKKTEGLSKKLREMALAAGWQEKDGEEFNPGSTKQLGELLFKKMGFKPYRTTDSGNVSTDKETLTELAKDFPDNEFLQTLKKFRDYAALHPENLKFDPRDNSARMYLKQNVVGGGRLSGAGGEFERDGGFELNPQGVKKLEPDQQWRVYGNVLDPDEIPADQVEMHEESDLHPSCFRTEEKTEKHVVGQQQATDWETGMLRFNANGLPVVEDVYEERKVRVTKKAPSIVNNHIGMYQGYAICLVPSCTTCAEKFSILIPNTSMDANETVNLRCLFVAQEEGWTFFSIDYSNIEVRAAANLSGEPELQKIFLEGDGDHHALTASKVFPSYNDPNSPDYKAKSLRSLAKIINFALQYGGTEYTIYESMSKKDPTITRERCKEMVDNYWKGVPVFADWCSRKRARARNEMVCETATGRVINFESALRTKHITKPGEMARKNVGKYYDLRRTAAKMKAEGNDEGAEQRLAAADQMWKNPDTGVRNALEYNKFLGKIERVSVNAPVQGIAGDFMRIALNRIRMWVMKDPLVQQVFRLHGSVHDEIDLSIKNEYVPFILPRLTRLMKLRKYHEQMKWPVPIECDAEYGRSWDVDYNVTDKKHPDAYTKIKGISGYVPDEVPKDAVKKLLEALFSGVEQKRERVKNWLEQSVHPRAFQCVPALMKEKEQKEIKRTLLAILQLHEYWTIDHTPDGDEYDKQMETLEQYERRMGFDSKTRGNAPEFGYLGAIPLTANVERPVIEPLGDEPTPDQQAPPSDNTEPHVHQASDPHVPDEPCACDPEPGPMPQVVEQAPKAYVLRTDLQRDDVVRLRESIGTDGSGTNTITVQEGKGGPTRELKNRKLDHIPQEFLENSSANGAHAR